MDISVQPSRDIAYFNRMANHADITAHVRDDRYVGELDLTPLLSPENIFLKLVVDGAEAGFAIMLKTRAQVLEMHSGLLTPFRGGIAIKIGRAVVDWVMTHTNTVALTTWAWGHARHVQLMARRVGFKQTGVQPWPWPVNGADAVRINYAITLLDWVDAQQAQQPEPSFPCL